MGLPAFYFDSRFLDGMLAASSTENGYHAQNVTDFRPYTFWKPDPAQTTSVYSLTVTGLPSGLQSANYLLIYGHTLGSVGGTTVEVLSGDDAGSLAPVAGASVVVTDDKPVLLPINAVPKAAWQVRFTKNDPGDEPAETAIVALGNALEIPAGIREGFDPIGRDLEGRTNISVIGNPIGKIIDYQSWKQSLTFELLQWDWVRDTFLPAWQSHLKGTPFVFAWDPEDYPNELFLVNAGDSFTTPHRAGMITDLTVQVMGVAPQF